MGANHSLAEKPTPLLISTRKALIAQRDGCGPVISKAVGEEGQPMLLSLGEYHPRHHWESALARGKAISATFRRSFGSYEGNTILTMTRNHWPKQVVREYTSPQRRDKQTKTPAVVVFTDDMGATVAELHSDVSSFCRGYFVGGGRSVLYAAKDDLGATHQCRSPRDVITGGASEQEHMCRFCLMDEQDDEKLLWPCACHTPVHRKCLARWQRLQAPESKQHCEVCKTAWSALPGLSIESHDGKELHAIAEVRPVITPEEAANRGYFYVANGGVGLYCATEPGAFATTPELVFETISDSVFNLRKEKVAWCAPNHGATPATKKIVVAAGVDALLVLALASEKDANIWGGGQDATLRG